MLSVRPKKPKKCRNPACRSEFTPERPMQTVCSYACGLALVKTKQEKEGKKQAKAERAKAKAAKEKLKTKAQHMKEAQAVVNRYVRLRDARLGCVSCERTASWEGQWHASHFRSVGAAPSLRFNLHNIHKACSICNNHLSGNIMGYRPEIIRRIGESRVDALEANQIAARFTIDYLKRLKRVFSKKCRRLGRRMECNVM